MPVTKGIEKLIAEAKTEIDTISTEEAIAELGNDKVVFIDIRDVRELEREGTIEGSHHAPRGMLEFWFDPASPYHREAFGDDSNTYVLFCQSAWRSVLATKTLKDMGLDNVKHFDGGFKGWKEAGGPVVEFSRKK